MKQMTLDDLLEEIEHLSSKLHVYVWVDGERYPLNYVDKSFIREGFIEFNAVVTQRYQLTPEEHAFMEAYLRNVASATEDNVLYFLEHRKDEKEHDDWWWTSVMDAWLVWQDAKKFTQGESK